MSRIINQIQHRDSGLARSSESGIKISPLILLVVAILSAIFFIYVILHLLIRFFLKRRSLSSVSHSTPYEENSSSSGSLPIQDRQVSDDSGHDQSAIDALPIFHYKDIIGLKESMDCAVCSCEFTVEDRLRLIPTCSHAFHSKCIDTWFQSTSTCPLCRVNLSPCLTTENPLFDLNRSRESLSAFSIVTEKETSGTKLLSVRLGKFRSIKNEGENGEKNVGESGGCILDAKRCFLMGSLEYVVGNSDLKVAVFDVNEDSSSVYEDMHGKTISRVIRGCSFCVPKNWLWSKFQRG